MAAEGWLDLRRRVLVTGGAGFIGRCFVRYLLAAHPETTVTNLDSLTYAGRLENLMGVDEIEPRGRYSFVKGDITDEVLVRRLARQADDVVNFAAESHVDRSIEDPSVFIRTNVLGTETLLNAARRGGVGRFVQVSTDEVYGALGPEGLFTEETPLRPNSPYAASKAGADLVTLAYYRTYGLPAVITRSSNNYGPFQYPEKLIPRFILNALADRPLPIYGDGRQVRDWLYVEDNCRAIDLVRLRGRPGEVYNVARGDERTNLEVTRRILELVGKPASLISFVRDRLGHDRRYAMDASKVRELGWRPRQTFEAGLKATVKWYLDNAAWWMSIRTGAGGPRDGADASLPRDGPEIENPV